MRVANRALKMAIAKVEGISDINDIYTMLDASRRFGVARNTIARWSDLGIFKAHIFSMNGRQYSYYTKTDCDTFAESNFYKSLPMGIEKMYARVSATVHDFDELKGLTVYTSAELAEKLGISVQTVNRMHNSGVLIASKIKHNNRIYRYYTEQQYLDFLQSDEYLNFSHVKNSDLIGTYSGKLKIVSFSEEAVRKGYYGSYMCQCECGNVVDIPRSEILAGKAKSCGCKYHDLSGRTFGLWHVDSMAEPVYSSDGNKLFRYNCTCMCGKKGIVYASSLRQGHSQSCGCHNEPLGETYIRQYFSNLGLLPLLPDESGDGYIQHKTYSDLCGIGGNKLSYDFYVRIGVNEWLIEYQGLQHYVPVGYFGGDEQFATQQEHDRRKKFYAAQHDISFVEISYEYAIYDDIVRFLVESGITYKN